MFPGLIYRMDEPKLAILVFASGKVNFVGVKERDDAYKALEKTYPLVEFYEKRNVLEKVESILPEDTLLRVEEILNDND